ncbi:MAG: hypothetical protein ABI862_14025 [Ilumatobacteraceae bacterium]
MDPPITYAELVEAVDVAHRAINRGQTITMDTWDRILPTLVQAHSLCGSTTRNLIRRMFDATYFDHRTLADAVAELHRNLTPIRARGRSFAKRQSGLSRELNGQLKLI